MLGADAPAEALVARVLRHRPDVICMSLTMPAGTVELTDAILQVQYAWPEAQFVVGGRGLGSQLRSQGGVGICERVSEVVEAVDARVKRAELNSTPATRANRCRSPTGRATTPTGHADPRAGDTRGAPGDRRGGRADPGARLAPLVHRHRGLGAELVRSSACHDVVIDRAALTVVARGRRALRRAGAASSIARGARARQPRVAAAHRCRRRDRRPRPTARAIATGTSPQRSRRSRSSPPTARC